MEEFGSHPPLQFDLPCSHPSDFILQTEAGKAISLFSSLGAMARAQPDIPPLSCFPCPKPSPPVRRLTSETRSLMDSKNKLILASLLSSPLLSSSSIHQGRVRKMSACVQMARTEEASNMLKEMDEVLRRPRIRNGFIKVRWAGDIKLSLASCSYSYHLFFV